MASSNQPPLVPFMDQVFTLASLTHVCDYSPTVPPHPILEQKKHLRLLDAIALLLVTEEKSDVAAVMFEQTPSEVIFYYSKNRPCTPRERDNLDALRRLAFAEPDVQQCARRLLNRVVPFCRAKILMRLKRLATSIPQGLVVSNDLDGAFHQHFKLKMPHLFPNAGAAASPGSSRQILLNYIGQVRTNDPKKCTDNDLCRLIRFASAIGCYERLKDLIHDDTIIRRLRKLGNYYVATKVIARTVGQARQGHQRYRVDNVIFREVPPQAQSITNISNDVVATLNRYGASCGLDPVTGSNLKAVYTNAFTGENAKTPVQRVTHSVHAECTVAMHALGMGKDWTYVEIGVSKGCCWLCQQFLAQLRRSKVNFLVSRFHGKLQAGWTFPPTVGDLDRVLVEGVVGHALQEIVERVLNRRRSDSFPHSESEDEIEESQPEDGDDDLGWVNGVHS